jgi:ADP-ribosylglycohydrolase
MENDVTKDRVLGAIFGEAIGDALGHPIEFRKTHVVKILEPDNKFTDDTQMFCAIGEALLDAPPHVDEGAFMKALSKRFIDWKQNPLGGSHRGPGNNCMEAVRRLRAGKSWLMSGGIDFKGNGTAMRSGIVGAYYWKNPEYAFRIGGMTSVPTHYNLEAILGAAVVSYLVAQGIAGMSPGEAVAKALILCGRWKDENLVPHYPYTCPLGDKWEEQSPWYAISLWGAAFALTMSPLMTRQAIPYFTEGRGGIHDGVVVPAVAEGIYFSHGEFRDYSACVLSAVNNSHDTDTIGAISGTMLGARVGYEAIPSDWTSRIELRDYFLDLGNRIHEGSLKYELPSPTDDDLIDEFTDQLDEELDPTAESADNDVELLDDSKF